MTREENLFRLLDFTQTSVFGKRQTKKSTKLSPAVVDETNFPQQTPRFGLGENQLGKILLFREKVAGSI